MPDTPSIVINKRMTYRGVAEITSNIYHFSGTTPANDADWRALALAIWGAEAPITDSSVSYVGYLGYAAGNEHAVSIRDYIADGVTPIAGSAGSTGGNMPGDCAAWVRWTTPDRTSRGKRIYLRKYFHEVPYSNDLVDPTWKTNALTYANKMIDGTLPGGAKVCGPQGAVASTPFVGPYVTTRSLKRRGKRPSS